MNKPQPKREVIVRFADRNVKHIYFYASSDAIEDFRDFGVIAPNFSHHCLIVDQRYDFEEVLEYVENYDKEN